RGPRRPALPRRRDVDAGWVPRRRPLLRVERLPHHDAAARRVGSERPHRATRLLGSPRAPSPPGARARAGGYRPVRIRVRGSRPALRHPRRLVRRDRLRRELALRLLGPELLPAVQRAVAVPAHVVTRDRGTVLPALAVHRARAAALAPEAALPDAVFH